MITNSGLTRLTSITCLFGLFLFHGTAASHHEHAEKDIFNKWIILESTYSASIARGWCDQFASEVSNLSEITQCNELGEGTQYLDCDATYTTGSPADNACNVGFYCKDLLGRLLWDIQGFCPSGGIVPTKNYGKPTCPPLGNPVHASTGNKFEQELDYSSALAGGIRYRRYYNSQTMGFRDRIGAGWSADYWQLIVLREPDLVNVVRPDFKQYRFRSIDGAWVADADVTLQLVALTDAEGAITGWRLTLPDRRIEEYIQRGSVGRLRSVTAPNGLVTTVVSDLSEVDGGDGHANTPDKIIGPFGRELRLQYGNLKLEKLIDPVGNEISYSHDANSRLLSVTYPDVTPGDPNDNPQRRYHYEDSNYPNHLTGITDENNYRFARWAYDSFGRAVLSEHANGVERVDIVYNADGTTTATDALGNVQTYHFEVIHGAIKAKQIEGDLCANCRLPFQNMTYDANGFVASKTDFNGNLTTYINNSRGLEISRTEGSGTADERTITTDWHPDFRVPTLITAPGRITEFSYDALGRLLSRKVSAP